MGRTKGENRIRHHLQAVFKDKNSKLKVMWWLERLTDELIRQGQRNGHIFFDEEGNLSQASQY